MLQVRECPHGKGVFALTAFKKGASVHEFDDIILTTTPLSPPSKRHALIVGETPGGQHLFWDEEVEGSESYWSNFLDHDPSPNVRFVIDTVRMSARLVAVREVEPGEELLLDYKEYHPDNWTPAESEPRVKV